MSIAAPWNNRAGSFSALRAVAFAAALAPALLLAWAAATGGLGAKPVTAAIHESGDWAIRFLIASLAVTPLRRIGPWPKLIIIRRLLGLTALAYAIGHLSLYVLDQGFDLGRIASEIVQRIYLLIGFAALLGLTVLGITSTDAMIRRMGRAWHRLHRIVYGIATLAVVHFFLQSKIDATEATLVLGLFVLVMMWRLVPIVGLSLADPRALAGVGVLAALLTAGLEAGWYGLATGIPALRILEANLYLSPAIRPAWWILGAGLAAAAVNLRLPGRRASAL